MFYLRLAGSAIRRWLARIVPQWEYLSWARDRFGPVFALRSYRRALAHIAIKVKAGSGYVYLRPGTTDQLVFDDVFLSGQYAVDVGNPRFVIDAGAHIGLTAVFFAQRYPGARIVAIELDESNFRMLRRNTRACANVVPLHAGLWNRSTTLKVTNPTANTWSFRAEEGGGGVPGLTVSDLMRDHGVDSIDLLKIDIEGGEKGVFDHSGEWMKAVKALAVELHDRHVPGCTASFERAIHGHAFRRFMSRDTMVLVRE